jgi:hypothetical protein
MKNRIIIKHITSAAVAAVFVFIAFGSGDSKGESFQSKFCNNDFYSSEATIFGQTGRKVIMFRKNEYFNFKNTVTVLDENKFGNTNVPSNQTDGFWEWDDSLKFTIKVKFVDGNNKDCSGIWNFSEDFKTVTIPPNSINLFRYEEK